MNGIVEDKFSRAQGLLNHAVAAILVASSAYTILSLLRISNLPAGTLPTVAVLSIGLTVVIVVKIFKGLLNFPDTAIAVRHAVLLAITSVVSSLVFVWCVQGLSAHALEESKKDAEASAQACIALDGDHAAEGSYLKDVCAKYAVVKATPN